MAGGDVCEKKKTKRKKEEQKRRKGRERTQVYASAGCAKGCVKKGG